MDVFSLEKRSEVMRRIRGKNTGPEMAVRKLLHALGYRFRLHRTDLVGKPDIVLPKYQTVVFVHGCFWHGHNCKDGRRPLSNIVYWDAKLDRNKNRDRKCIRQLKKLGWKVLVVWECEAKDVKKLTLILRRGLPHSPQLRRSSRE